MSDGRKRSRKSKLEVRSDVDIDETENTILQIGVHSQPDDSFPPNFEQEFIRQRNTFKDKQKSFQPHLEELEEGPAVTYPRLQQSHDQSRKDSLEELLQVNQSQHGESDNDDSRRHVTDGVDFTEVLVGDRSEERVKTLKRSIKMDDPDNVGKIMPDNKKRRLLDAAQKPIESPRLPFLLQSKTFDHTYSLQNVPERPPSPIQLHVKVEVEEFDESIMDNEVAELNKDIMNFIAGPSSGLTKPRKKCSSPIRAFYVNLDKMYKISDHIIWSSINPADKFLGVELKNIWGRVLKPEEDTDPHNALIQKSLTEWGTALMMTKILRETPLFYQCHLCNRAWWYLEPFRNHIRSHDHRTLKVYLQEDFHESIMVASNSIQKVVKYIKCDGDCYRCGNSFDYHAKISNLQYTCMDCFHSFPTCSVLKHHQPMCLKTPIDYPESQTCRICQSQFLHAQDLVSHMVTYHLVRSDIPIAFSMKVCAGCGKRYHHYSTHMCVKSSMNSACTHCYRKFPTRVLAELHIRMGQQNYKCKICGMLMQMRCMETEHMLTHTDKYKVAYKCINAVCPPNMLFPDEMSIRMHKLVHHNQKHDKRRTYYELVVVPTQSQQSSAFVDLNSALWEYRSDADKGPAPTVEEIQDEIDIKEELPGLDNVYESDENQDGIMDYEEMLAKVFKVSDNVHTTHASAAETTAADIKIEQEELDFEKLIDLQKDPITIKTEPRESNEPIRSNNSFEKNDPCESNVPYESDDPFESNEPYELIEHTEVDLESDIKTEPEDFEIDCAYNELMTSIKTEPAEVKTELVEATEMKIINTFSDKPKSSELPTYPARLIPVKIQNTFVKIKPAPVAGRAPLLIKRDQIMTMPKLPRLRPKPINEITEVKFLVRTYNKNKSLLKKNLYGNTLESKTQNQTQKETELKPNVPQDIGLEPNKAQEGIGLEPNKMQDKPTGLQEDLDIDVKPNALQDDVIIIDQIESQEVIDFEPDVSHEDVDLKPNGSQQDVDLKLNASQEDVTSEQNVSDQNADTEPNQLQEIKIELSESEQASDCETYVPYRNTKVKRRKKKIKTGQKGPKHKKKDELRATRIYTCTKCGYANCHKLYRIHVNSNCEQTPNVEITFRYKCTKCDLSFSMLKFYLLHFQNHGYTDMQCPSCSLKFDTLKELMPHFQKHVRQNFVSCWMINKNLVDVPTKKQHRCQICRQTVTPRQFFTHWEGHLRLAPSPAPEPVPEPPASPSDEAAFSHAPSNAKTLQPAVLLMALQQLRSVLREKQCLICKRVFSRRHDCKRHIIEHLLMDAHTKKADTQSFRCQICSTDFGRAARYKFHMREHGALPVYKCDLCDKTFSDSSNFAKHKKIHSLKVLICDICKKKFHAKSSLEKHMMMHEVTDPIKCDICGKCFYSVSHFNKHVQARHVRPSRFKCILCDVFFDSLRKKWDHMWTAHQERKHKADCPICPKGFRKFLDLKLHAQIEHRVDLSFLKVKKEGVVTTVKTMRKLEATPSESLYIHPDMLSRYEEIE